jgi:hypothetical protein
MAFVLSGDLDLLLKDRTVYGSGPMETEFTNNQLFISSPAYVTSESEGSDRENDEILDLGGGVQIKTPVHDTPSTKQLQEKSWTFQVPKIVSLEKITIMGSVLLEHIGIIESKEIVIGGAAKYTLDGDESIPNLVIKVSGCAIALLHQTKIQDCTINTSGVSRVKGGIITQSANISARDMSRVEVRYISTGVKVQESVKDRASIKSHTLSQ